MKTCFKCNKEKELSDFYKHKQMGDGHLNKCKVCTRDDVNSRKEILSQEEGWLEKERLRHREKYKRLNYKDKQKEWDLKRPWTRTSTYRNLSRDLRIKEGNNIHHWNYNNKYLKDVFILSTESHKKLHTFLDFDEENLIFKTKKGTPLDTKRKHKEYMEEINLNK